MNKMLNRREILKLAGLLPLAYYLPSSSKQIVIPSLIKKRRNIIVVVFDAFTAKNMSLYSYPRETTPNINRLADNATVYHNHYATANFTTPGTASLLTGTYPWTHRGLNLNGRMIDAFKTQNIFSLFGDHFRIVYSQNPVANILLDQMDEHIDIHQPWGKLFITYDTLIDQLFKNDFDTASVAWTRAVKPENDDRNYSLLLSHFYPDKKGKEIEKIKQHFPRGVPVVNKDNYFTLEKVIDWTKDQVVKLPEPFLGYFHYLPPHEPYKTRLDFMNTFAYDDWPHEFNPNHIFTSTGFKPGIIIKNRTRYDEYILYVDSEFARLYEELEKAGLLENSWLILTSDHGEMFDRGIVGHGTEYLFQPLVHIPLLIFEPGQQIRKDIFSPTSAVDLLPTLLNLSDQEIPDWCEGQVLPPYNHQEPDSERSIFALEAKKNEKNSSINKGTAMILKGKNKLTYYYGYDELEGDGTLTEFYDINNDPDELNNLYDSQPKLANQFLDELQRKLHTADVPYS
jgi:arylsulfatase A-like enzyme